MKLKQIVLFEQSAQPEFHYPAPGENVDVEIINNSFEPSYAENFVYAFMYRVGGDTIFLRRAKNDRKMVVDQKELAPFQNDFENIRWAIEEFDQMARTYELAWKKTAAIESEDELPF